MTIEKLVYADEAKKIEVTGTWMCSRFVVQPSQEAVWVLRKLSHQLSIQEKSLGQSPKEEERNRKNSDSIVAQKL